MGEIAGPPPVYAGVFDIVGERVNMDAEEIEREKYGEASSRHLAISICDFLNSRGFPGLVFIAMPPSMSQRLGVKVYPRPDAEIAL